jgi:gas vesicle protein
MDQRDFIKGAVIGGILGSLAALLAAPKSGRELRADLLDGHGLLNNTASYAEELKSHAQEAVAALGETDHDHHRFLVGSAIGAVVGVVAALLMAPQSGDRLRRQLGDQYEDIRSKAEGALHDLQSNSRQVANKIDGWKETLVSLVDKLSTQKSEAILKRGGDSSHIGEIADWATLGLKLYSQLRDRSVR